MSFNYNQKIPYNNTKIMIKIRPTINVLKNGKVMKPNFPLFTKLSSFCEFSYDHNTSTISFNDDINENDKDLIEVLFYDSMPSQQCPRFNLSSFCILTRGKNENMKWGIIKRSKTMLNFPGYLAFPGGFIENKFSKNDTETLKECALRELQEELGIEVNEKDLKLEKIMISCPNGTHTIMTLFKCQMDEIKEMKLKQDEVEEFTFMTREEIEIIIKNQVVHQSELESLNKDLKKFTPNIKIYFQHLFQKK